MSAYTSSKAALEATIRSWRVEHPERRFLRIVMGATMPTDFGTSFDANTLGTAFERWMAAGVAMTAMDTDEVGRHLAETLAVILAHPTIDVPELCLDPRGQAWPQGGTP
jgi:NAD(P)-dependent dehydrogenase (short-subunit alcohol dehydrogenase family)